MTEQFSRFAIALLLTNVWVTNLLAQSDIAFAPEVYAARRMLLMEQIGNAALIVPGKYMIQPEHILKQNPNFWYLTGVESPYAILVVVPEENGLREVLFLPEHFQFAVSNFPQKDLRFRAATWNQPIRRLYPGDEAQTATGIAETYLVDDFKDRVLEIVSEKKTIYFMSDSEEYYAPPGLSPATSFSQQLESDLAAIFPGATMKDATPLVNRMRDIKDEHEIALIRRAVEISTMSLAAAGRAIEPGKNALELVGLMQHIWKREGAPHVSHPPMFAVGPDSLRMYALSYENYNNVDHIMQAGELAYVDYGVAEVDMYASDVCRTFPVSGKFTPEQRKYYDIVVEAEEAALASIKPGAKYIDLVKASAGVFKKYGLQKYEDIDAMGVENVWGIFPSPTHFLGEPLTNPAPVPARGLGHHVDLVVARTITDPDTSIEPGMVITIEPKLYIPELGTGMMIEDMILITEDGYENLSKNLARTADEIEALMAQ